MDSVANVVLDVDCRGRGRPDYWASILSIYKTTVGVESLPWA